MDNLNYSLYLLIRKITHVDEIDSALLLMHQGRLT